MLFLCFDIFVLTFPQLSRLPGEVWGDRRGDEGLHGFPMDLLEHEQDLWALGDQFAFTAGVKLLNTNSKKSSCCGYRHAAKTSMMARCFWPFNEGNVL